MVNILSKMNSDTDYSGINGDKAFLHALFLRIFGPDMHHKKLQPKKLKFAKGA